MTNFIEEFYYGNIDPQARSFEQNKKVQRDMQILTDNEDFLTDKLSGEEKKRFLQYVDAYVLGKATKYETPKTLADVGLTHTLTRYHPRQICKSDFCTLVFSCAFRYHIREGRRKP